MKSEGESGEVPSFRASARNLEGGRSGIRNIFLPTHPPDPSLTLLMNPPVQEAFSASSRPSCHPVFILFILSETDKPMDRIYRMKSRMNTKQFISHFTGAARPSMARDDVRGEDLHCCLRYLLFSFSHGASHSESAIRVPISRYPSAPG